MNARKALDIGIVGAAGVIGLILCVALWPLVLAAIAFGLLMIGVFKLVDAVGDAWGRLMAARYASDRDRPREFAEYRPAPRDFHVDR